MNLSVGKIVGSQSGSAWSQVHSFVPEDVEKLDSHGELHAAISFKTKAEIDISSFGTEIITRLQEIYYGNESTSILTKLSQTVETLAAEFLDQVELEVVAVVYWREILYGVKNNLSSQIWLLRENQLVRLFAGGDSGLATVSGRLLPGDTFLAGTGQFNQLVPEDKVKSFLALTEIGIIGESLSAIVHGHEVNSCSAAVIGKIPEAVKAIIPVQPNYWPMIKSWLRRLKPTRPIILLGSRSSKSKKISLTVGLLLLALFGASLGLSGRKKQQQAKQVAYQQLVNQVNYKLDEANNLLLLNPLRAKSLLAESQQMIEVYQQDHDLDQPLKDLSAKVAEALEQTQREFAVEAVEWYDFDLIKEGFRGERWDGDGEQVLSWDSQSHAGVWLNLKTKAATIAIVDEQLSLRAIGFSNDRGYLVTGDSVVVVDTAKEKTVAAVAADGWQNIVSARGFGGNLYLLDAAVESQIWKYLGLDDGLSGKRSYLTGETYDLSEAVDLAVDGSVWVIFSDGTIAKYTQGTKDAFQLIGLELPLSESTQIFTSPAVDHLYLLDKNQTRVIVVDKSGEYFAQYIWPGIAGVKDFMVSEEMGKIFFLTGEKIFAIDLKQ